MTALTKTATGQWQLGRDDDRTLVGIDVGNGHSVMILERAESLGGFRFSVTVRTELEAQNVITFLQMAFPGLVEEGEG